MKHFFIFMFFSISSLSLIAQTIDSAFCFEGSFRVKGLMAGNSFTVPCDTVYLLNKSTYYLYKNLYNTSRTGNSNAQLIKSLFAANQLYEGRIQEQDTAYNLLLQKFDSLHFASANLVKTSLAQTATIERSIGEANQSIEKMRNSVDILEQGIRAERRRSFVQKVLAFGGGIGVGVLVGVIVAK